MLKSLSFLLLVAAFLGSAMQVQAQTACTGSLTVSLTGSTSGAAGAAPTFTAAQSSQTFCASLNKTVGDLLAPVSGTTFTYYTVATGGTAVASTITIPTGTTTYYVSQTVSSCESGTRSTIAVTVNPTVTPSVSIAVPAGANPTCPGTSVTFTASPTNGGTSPTYQWSKNSVAISGATNVTYASTALATGDMITVELTTNAPCATTPTATSNAITMTVNPTVTPSVSIAVPAGANPTCAGTSVTFTATPTNGGTTPTYQWSKNSVAISGATSVTYMSSTLITGDVITVLLTSTAPCATTPTATSNSITMTVNALPIAHTCTPVNDACQLSAGQINVEVHGGTPNTSALKYNVSATGMYISTGSGPAVGTAVTTITAPTTETNPTYPTDTNVYYDYLFTNLPGNATYIFTITDKNGCKSN